MNNYVYFIISLNVRVYDIQHLHSFSLLVEYLVTAGVTLTLAIAPFRKSMDHQRVASMQPFHMMDYNERGAWRPGVGA